MSNITVNIILGWCGISIATNCNHIIADMLTAPEGIDHLNDESTEGDVVYLSRQHKEDSSKQEN